MKDDSTTEDTVLKETFGILKHLKKPTEKLLREVNEELWFEDHTAVDQEVKLQYNGS